MTTTKTENRRADRLYYLYGTPLEATRRGKYLAASRDSKTLPAPSLDEANDKSAEAVGPDNVVFRTGDQVVSSGPWLTAQSRQANLSVLLDSGCV